MTGRSNEVNIDPPLGWFQALDQIGWWVAGSGRFSGKRARQAVAYMAEMFAPHTASGWQPQPRSNTKGCSHLPAENEPN